MITPSLLLLLVCCCRCWAQILPPAATFSTDGRGFVDPLLDPQEDIMVPLPPHNIQQQQRRRRMQASSSSAQSAPLLSQLRQDILAEYDRGAFPFEDVWRNQTTSNRLGLEVEIGINFHRVFKVEVTSSVADLIVWFRQRWKDPRLAWDPEDYGGLKTAWFWVGSGTGPGGETSEIWTPDMEMWNLETSLSISLVDQPATVASDGTVFWSRPGHLRPVCKFAGLSSFPFDTLSCTVEIGSWVYSGLYIRPIKMGEGFTIGGSETAGESYSEFSLQDVACETHLYPPYPSLPEEDWPVLFYHITFSRAWQPYARGYLVLQILLNLASFACFWLPANGGERMSLNISSVLASVASELVVASNLPAASEMTWFARFSIASLGFTVMALFESAAVIYFYYHTGSSLVPRWMRCLLAQPRKKQEKEEPPTGSQSVDHPDTHATGSARKVVFHATEEVRTEDDTGPQHDQDHLDQSSSDGDPMDGDHDHESEHHHSVVGFRKEDATINTRATTDASSISQVPRQSIRTIMGRDADDFKNLVELENNIRWQKVARLLDEISRVVFPVAFAVFMGTTFSGLSL